MRKSAPPDSVTQQWLVTLWRGMDAAKSCQWLQLAHMVQGAADYAHEKDMWRDTTLLDGAYWQALARYRLALEDEARSRIRPGTWQATTVAA